VYTDEYSIYARLCAWGYDHKSVNHGRGEFARDEDGDGFCEVHVNTMGCDRSIPKPYAASCSC
jgi:transposase